MRIYFTNTQKPKKVAKAITSIANDVRLSDVQKHVAITSGYRDWHDLEQHHADATPNFPAREMTRKKFLGYFGDQVRHLAQELNISWSDSLYALSEARLLDNGPLSLEEYEAVWLDLFREFHPLQSGRHAPGTLVRVKTPGYKDEPGYIKHHGNGVGIILNGSVNALRADFEVVVPRKPVKLFVPARLKYIYGEWTEADGAKVLFSRDYKPMWRIHDGRRPERVQPWEWISYVDQKWFWEDATTPWHSSKRQAEEEQRIRSYGIRALPILTNALPLVLFDPSLKNTGMNDAVSLMKNASEHMTVS